MKPKSWRDVIAIHPSAELQPMMTADELKALAADIKANGLLNKVMVFEDRDAGERLVLDGRNRLDALELLGGVKATLNADGTALLPHMIEVVSSDLMSMSSQTPDGLSTALNMRRRHLSSEQKREVIANYITIFPTLSDLAVAKTIGVDHKTVASVRAEIGQRNWEIPNTTAPPPALHTASGRVEAALLARPELLEMSHAAIAREVGVSTFTVRAVKKKVAATMPALPKPPAAPKSTPRPKPESEPREKPSIELMSAGAVLAREFIAQMDSVLADAKKKRVTWTAEQIKAWSTLASEIHQLHLRLPK